MVAEFKKLTKSAKAPTKGTTGYDIYADCKEAVCIYPHTSATIGTGLHIKAPDGYIPVVFAKNGLVLTRGLRFVSCIEGYNNDYAEYKVLMHNDSSEIRYIFPDDKIAQIVFIMLKALIPPPLRRWDECLFFCQKHLHFPRKTLCFPSYRKI